MEETTSTTTTTTTVLSNKRNIIIIAVLAVVLLILIIFFLGRLRTGNNGNNNNTTSTGQAVLQWWGAFLDAATVQPLIDEYEAQNQGIEIQYINKWPGGNRNTAEAAYYGILDQVLKNNNPAELPDIFMVDNTMVGYYENVTTVAPASVITPSEVGQNFYPAVTSNFVKSNQVRGLPLWIDSLAIVYNRNLLAAAGVTQVPNDWQELKNLAQRLTTTLGTTRVFGFAAGTTNNTSFSTELLQLLVRQNNATLTDSRGNASFNSSDFANALSFLQAFAKEDGGTWDNSGDNDALRFAKGQLAMLVAPSWRLADLLEVNTSQNLGLNIGVAPMPQIIGSGNQIHWTTYWGNLVTNNRPNSAAAWQFLDWLTQPAQLRKLRQADQAKRSNSSAFIYPRTDMATELQNDQNLRPYVASLPFAESWYTGNGQKVKAALSELIQSSGGSSQIQGTQTKVQQALTEKL